MISSVGKSAEVLSSKSHCVNLGIGRNELVAQSVEQRTFNAWVVGSIPTELTTFMSIHRPALSIRSQSITALHDQCTSVWHLETPVVSGTLTGFEHTVAEQHLANFELWHLEDTARAPQATDHQLAEVKRLIDRANQRRNDLSEQCDALLLEFLSCHQLPDPAAPLHSESPGLILDRLSILSLKLFHTREEIDRPGSPAGHGERNRERLRILAEQRDDLAGALDHLWQQVLDRQQGFKLYRQLKMYNDPALNPAVYNPPVKGEGQ